MMVAFDQPIVFYLTIPTNATTGARIVLDGINGFVLVYNSSNQLIGSISGKDGTDNLGNTVYTGITDYDPGNSNVYVQLNSGSVLYGYAGVNQNNYFAGSVTVASIATNIGWMIIEAPSLNLNSGTPKAARIQLFGTDQTNTQGPSLTIDSPDFTKVPCFVDGTWNVLNEVWHDVVYLGNGWANAGAPYRNVQYRFDVLGRVVFKGMAAFTGTDSAPSFMFTMPAAYRPPNDVRMVSTNEPSGDATPAQCQVLYVFSKTASPNPGLVQITNFAGTINPGPISFENIAYYL